MKTNQMHFSFLIYSSNLSWPITNFDLANKIKIFFFKTCEHYKFWNFVNWKINNIFLEVENLH
jgi:hypothetical protein